MARYEKLLKALGLGAAGVAASLASSNEAEAAGIETIAKKLGVSLEEAKKIKDAATKIVNPNEENIKAVQAVRDVYTRPKKFKAATKVGSGADAQVYESKFPGQVVKEFTGYGPAVEGIREYPERLQFPASMLEAQGLGPKSKTVKTSSNVYQVQEKINPLKQPSSVINEYKDLKNKRQDIQKIYQNQLDNLKYLPENERGKALDDLFAKTQLQEDELAKIAYKRKYGVDYEDTLKKLDTQENPHWGSKDANPESLDAMLASYAQTKAMQSVPQLHVRDVHTGNVGINPLTSEPQIFDTSRFGIKSFKNVSPEQQALTKQSYIALPEERQRFNKIFETPERSLKPGDIPSESKPVDLTDDANFQAFVEKEIAKMRGKKAAAIAPMGLAAQEEAPERLKEALQEMGSKYNEYVRKPIKESIVDPASESLAELLSMRKYASGNPEMQKAFTEADKRAKSGLQMAGEVGLDPLNFVEGPLGLGAAAIDLLASGKEDTQEENNKEQMTSQPTIEDKATNPRFNSLFRP